MMLARRYFEQLYKESTFGFVSSILFSFLSIALISAPVLLFP